MGFSSRVINKYLTSLENSRIQFNSRIFELISIPSSGKCNYCSLFGLIFSCKAQTNITKYGGPKNMVACNYCVEQHSKLTL